MAFNVSVIVPFQLITLSIYVITHTVMLFLNVLIDGQDVLVLLEKKNTDFLKCLLELHLSY